MKHALDDLSGGHIDVMVLPIGFGAEWVARGAVRALAVTGLRQPGKLANVPSITEFPDAPR